MPNGHYVSNPKSCQHWLLCQDEVAIEGVCPNTYYFDETIQMCRYPSYVDCQIDSVNVTCPIADLALLPHPSNCDQYVACINGFPRVINCAPGLNWDTAQELCDLPQNANCEVAPPDLEEEELVYICEPGNTYVTRHPLDCQQFIMCINGEQRINRCASDLLFDPANLRCDFAANVNCDLPEATVEYECDRTRDFYYAPHPASCDYYIVCFAGHKQIERCATGLIFDWLFLRCDAPATAVCLPSPPASV